MGNPGLCAKNVAIADPLVLGIPYGLTQFSYTTNADGISATITGYTGSVGTVDIPTNINGLVVNNIGFEAFLFNPGLVNVTVAESVTNIGYAAFATCPNLASVAMPGGVTTIGDYAFDDCPNLVSITIPDSVTSIGDSAFWRCIVVSVTIPASVTNFGEAPFGHSATLTAITVDTNNSFYCSVGGVSFSKNQSALIQVPGMLGGNYAIPVGVTNIGESAFDGCTGLTGVTIPDSVTDMGESAFDDCASLTELTIPSGITNIPEAAFDDCTSLTNLTIPGSVSALETLHSMVVRHWPP